MKPLLLFLAGSLALLAASPTFAAGPACAAGDAGSSTNWGPDFRERTRDVFDKVKAAAGVTQQVDLIYSNDTAAAGKRLINGTPLGAVPKGSLNLPHDSVFYTMGIFEIVCDEAQMAFFMAHEMRHLKVVDGKSHFDRVKECNKKILDAWTNSTDLSAYRTTDEAVAAFQAAKGEEMQRTCTKPVENEADAFAFDLQPQLPWKYAGAPDDPSQSGDARVAAFKRADDWLRVIGENGPDVGHDPMGVRVAVAAAKAWQKQLADQKAAEARANMTFANGPH